MPSGLDTAAGGQLEWFVREILQQESYTPVCSSFNSFAFDIHKNPLGSTLRPLHFFTTPILCHFIALRSASLPLRRSAGGSSKRLQEFFDGGSPKPAEGRQSILNVGIPLSPRRQDSGMMEGSRFTRSSTVSLKATLNLSDMVCPHRLFCGKAF